MIKEIINGTFADFCQYFMNAKLLTQGYNIWDSNSPGLMEQTNLLVSRIGVQCRAKVLHSMGFFFIISPLTYLPPKAAAILWIGLCQISLISSICVIVKALGRLDIGNAMRAFFLVLNFWPLKEDLRLGQPNALILLLFSLSLLSMKYRKFILAGIFLGLGIQIREFFLPMLLFCAFKKYWKSLASGITALLLLKLVSVLVFGIDKEIFYWRHHYQFFPSIYNFFSGREVDVFSVSVIDLWRRLSEGLLPAVVSQWAILILFFLVVWRGWKHGREVEEDAQGERLALEFSFFLVLCFILSPWVHETHFVVLCLPLLVSWQYIIESPSHKNFILFLAAYLILGLKSDMSKL